MIKEKCERDGWQFVFLGADLDAIGEAVDVGIRAAAAMAYDKTARGTAAAWGSLSKRVRAYRSSEAADVSFAEEDREKQEAEKQKPRV